jgi:porin
MLACGGLSALLAAILLPPATSARADDAELWQREKLTGDWGGLRTALANKGVEVELNYIGEAFGILSGGLRRGVSYEGWFRATVETDLEKLIGWTGGKTHVTAFYIHNGGRNAADLVGSLADPSNVDALPTVRLFTAWFDQDFGKSVSLRIGQLAADGEFLIADTAGVLVNGTFGWATIMAANLPSGGPAYPLATPGMRLKVSPTETVSLLAAVFSGDPAGKGCYAVDPGADPQACNRHGTTFSLHGGAFAIAEAQYQVNQGKDAKGLAAAYKIGAWYHTANFADQRYGIDAAGAVVSLATLPDNPLNHRGNWGVYGVIDRTLWRDGARKTSAFVRGGVAPSDRNLVSWYVDGGMAFKGLVPGRAEDILGFGVAHSKIGKNAAALDRDTLTLNGPPYPVRNGETVLELNYTAQIAPWWYVQPDLQYIIRPGGNVLHPDDPTRKVRDALLIGARTTISF